MRTVLIGAASALAFSVAVASPALACPQSVADRLAARSQTEWARDVLGNNPDAGLYRLAGVEGDAYAFTLVRPLTGDAPDAFSTQSFMTISCANGAVDWWAEERSVGDQVVVMGDHLDGGAFSPNLVYAESSTTGSLLLKMATNRSEEAQ
ncbi:MAG: hypothetical protein KKF88_12045 [Alphaproteobacteria bacterium]|nr:hypothetical protein [Alphaproteobacteria bacterium]